MTVLFFTSPIGLGHATRDFAIAKQLRKENDIDVTFVSGSGAAKLLSEYGFRVLDVYEPPAFDVASGHLQHRTIWLIRYMRYYYKCRKAAKNIIQQHAPKAIISDEDFASLSAYDGKKILITDIMESRFTDGLSGMAERRLNRNMNNIISECDAVITPNAEPDRGNIHNVGPIVRPICNTRKHLRKKYNMTKKTVLVTVGGTAAGKFLLDAMKPVSECISDVADTVFVAGPALDSLVVNLHEMIYAADVVVSLAGRSTMDEANLYGTPGVFIPISGHFEQEDNAAKTGHTHGDVHRLHDIILEALNRPHKSRTNRKDIDFGARRAASLIFQHLI